MKKPISILLALVMLLALTACGGTNAGTETPVEPPQTEATTPEPAPVESAPEAPAEA